MSVAFEMRFPIQLLCKNM